MLPIWYNQYKALIENALHHFIEIYFNSERSFKESMYFKDIVLYSLSWGKRIRSILALEFFCVFSKKNIEDIQENDDILKFCIALELLHAYSLVHDDLPCMDNDEYRRGEPTVWKKYGEYNAILAWDLLNSLAFEILWSFEEDFDIKPLLQYFWKSVWFHGMVGWQILDMFFETHPSDLSQEKIIEVHNKKTGCLITCAIVWWILLSKKERDVSIYENFWKNIWLAFQVKDDLLDSEWTIEETGKSVWWEKKWFVHFLWVEKTKEYLDLIISNSKDIIQPLHSGKLEFIIDYIKERKK
jgi:geranylgeranyl diphosphate synthase type II